MARIFVPILLIESQKLLPLIKATKCPMISIVISIPANSYGIIVDERIKPEEVIIKAYGVKAKYINTLPLHSSQKVVEQSETYTTFSLYLRPTYDLRQELLSHGEELEVLRPQWFREEFKSIITKQLAKYT